MSTTYSVSWKCGCQRAGRHVPLRRSRGVLKAKTDHVIMGAGLDIDVRLDIIREVFELSDSTTVHMKDFASGPQGMLPFVRAVLSAL